MSELSFLSDSELMIAAGLSMEGSGDWRYVAFANYSRELKARRITWAAAKKLKEKFKLLTKYPKRGWEGRYTRNIKRLAEDAQHASRSASQQGSTEGGE